MLPVEVEVSRVDGSAEGGRDGSRGGDDGGRGSWAEESKSLGLLIKE